MRVLVALDKFKDSMTAEEACASVAAELEVSGKGWDVDCCPLTDGGEGFTRILTQAAGGTLDEIQVEGPRGQPCRALLGLVSPSRIPPAARAMLGKHASVTGSMLAVADMASASGLALVPQGMRDLTRASSVGTGQLLEAARRAGAHGILLGVGGSATHDLGLGALGALGLRYRFTDGTESAAITPLEWPRLKGLAGKAPGGFPGLIIACDVDNPVLGPTGALATYGPQKGLRKDLQEELEASTARVAEMMGAHFGTARELVGSRGSGAAGGIAFGLMAALGASLVPGFELVANWLEVDRRIADADIVVTGEGRFDDSSLQGKGPGAVARRALASGKSVHVFAGSVSVSNPPAGLSLHPITPETMPLAQALGSARRLLRESVRGNLATR